MAVKPLPENQASKQIEEFINKGGKAKEESKKDLKDWTMISIRLPENLLKALDEKRKQQVGISRNAWILKIIQDNLLS